MFLCRESLIDTGPDPDGDTDRISFMQLAEFPAAGLDAGASANCDTTMGMDWGFDRLWRMQCFSELAVVYDSIITLDSLFLESSLTSASKQGADELTSL